jgi:hypothetical protein
MGANAGPDIVSDGLVLALDAADNNSFRGEPTENLFPNPQFLNHTNNSAGAASITKKTFDNGRVGIEMIQGSSSNIVSFSMGNLGGTGVSGGTYTWSSYINCTSTGNKVKAQVSIYVDGTRHWLTNSNTWTTSVVECSHLFSPTIANSWHRIENTFTLPTGTLTNFSLGEFYRNASNFTIKIADAHLELNPAATRFTTGTRGTTVAAGGGWADISGNDNHGTINNGASTSNDKTTRGALTFDSTNDYISKTRVQYGITDPWTVELIFKPTSQVSYWNGLFGGSLGQGGYWMFHSDQLTNYEGYSGDAGTRIKYTGWSYSNTFTVNQFHYLTITYSPIDSSSGTFNLYYNGTEKAQSYDRTFYWSHSLDSRYIGGIAAEGRYGAFTIPLYREYSRTLTQNEVLQNYNSQKSRFGL